MATSTQTFSSSGTWTRPNPDVTRVVITLIGGGGRGGQGGNGAIVSGGGGGGGGGSGDRRTLTLTTIPTSFSVTVGAGAPAIGPSGYTGTGGTSTVLSSAAVGGGGGGHGAIRPPGGPPANGGRGGSGGGNNGVDGSAGQAASFDNGGNGGVGGSISGSIGRGARGGNGGDAQEDGDPPRAGNGGRVTVVSTFPDPNQAPLANAGFNQVVDPGSSVSLDGSNSSDPDNDPITYAWTQTGGTSVSLTNATSANPSFTAPSTEGNLTFRLTVSDGMASDTDTVTITVATPNEPPIAHAGSNRTVSVGNTVFLDGSQSSDPEGGALTYAWGQTSGATVTLFGASTANPSFYASTSTTLRFSLTVTDVGGLTDSDSVQITVQSAPPPTPAAPELPTNIGPYSSTATRQTRTLPAAIHVGTTPSVYSVAGSSTLAEIISFNASTRQIVVDIFVVGVFDVTYTITDNAGRTNSRVVQFRRTAVDLFPVLPALEPLMARVDENVDILLPAASGGNLPLTYAVANLPQGLVFTVSSRRIMGVPSVEDVRTVTYTVTDSDGDVDSDQFIFTIEEALPQFPIADAGENQVVELGTSVLLSGNDSYDPGGRTIAYLWTQLTGTSVVLATPAGAQTAFIAPLVDSILTFRLTVSNGLESATADVEINVASFDIQGHWVTRKETAVEHYNQGLLRHGSTRPAAGIQGAWFNHSVNRTIEGDSGVTYVLLLLINAASGEGSLREIGVDANQIAPYVHTHI